MNDIQPVAKARKLIVPDKVRKLIGKNKAYVITHTNSNGDAVGYYLNSRGNISYREIPKELCLNSGMYTDLSDQFTKEELDYAKKVQTDFGRQGRLAQRLKDTDVSSEAELISQKKDESLKNEEKQKKAKQKAEDEASAASAMGEVFGEAEGPKFSEEDKKKQEKGRAKVNAINSPEAQKKKKEREKAKAERLKQGDVLDSGVAEFMTDHIKNSPDWQEHRHQLALQEQAKKEYASALAQADKASYSAKSTKDTVIADIKKDEFKPMYSYKQMNAKLKTWGKFISKLTSHIINMVGPGTYMSQILGVTIKPITDRMANLPSIIDNVFKDAGINDPNKWFEDHAGTAKAKRILKKTNDMASGMYDCYSTVYEEYAKYALESCVESNVTEFGTPCDKKYWTEARKKKFLTDAKAGRVENMADLINWGSNDGDRVTRIHNFIDNQATAAYQAYQNNKNNQTYAKYLAFSELNKAKSDQQANIKPLFENELFLSEIKGRLIANQKHQKEDKVEMTEADAQKAVEKLAKVCGKLGYTMVVPEPEKEETPKADKKKERVKAPTPSGPIADKVVTTSANPSAPRRLNERDINDNRHTF